MASDLWRQTNGLQPVALALGLDFDLYNFDHDFDFQYDFDDENPSFPILETEIIWRWLIL